MKNCLEKYVDILFQKYNFSTDSENQKCLNKLPLSLPEEL